MIRTMMMGLSLWALSGCASLGETGPSQQFYTLNDAKVSAVQPPPRSAARTLLVATSASASFYDSVRMAYSTQPGARAYYQFANWTTRPALRLGQLLVQRLNIDGKMNAALLSSEIQGDVLIEVRIDEFYHDASTTPGGARLAGQVEWIDRRTQQRLASKAFYIVAETTSRDAAGAAAAFQMAITRWLDETTTWLYQVVPPT